MQVISSREFRQNQKKYFEKIDNGEQIIVQRGKDKSYTLTPVLEDDLYFTPTMVERIAQSIEQIKEGKITKISSKKELKKLLEI
ncbi:MAG: prevent-host-death protein [Bacteroidales bacterium]|jgi:antitoxin YefM|nr:prevent-host-death protein [Bacteroidales bacterium]